MEAYPLTWPIGWPRTKYPIPSRFGKISYTQNHNDPDNPKKNFNKPTWFSAQKDLEEELRRLTGSNKSVISTNLQLRKDGLPHSSQREPHDQGVAVYFNYKDEQVVIACDTFDKIGCNLYAICKTIEAMRGIERWGCSDFLKRAFTGFAALPPAKDYLAPEQKHWWEILGINPNASDEEIRDAYREKAKSTHPDLGGSNEEFVIIKNAYDMALKRIGTVQK